VAESIEYLFVENNYLCRINISVETNHNYQPMYWNTHIVQLTTYGNSRKHLC